MSEMQVTSKYYSHAPARDPIRRKYNRLAWAGGIGALVLGRYAIGWRWQTRCLAATGFVILAKRTGAWQERAMGHSSIEVPAKKGQLFPYKRNENEPERRVVTGLYAWLAGLLAPALYQGIGRKAQKADVERLVIESPTCENGRSTILLNALHFKSNDGLGRELVVISGGNLWTADGAANFAQYWARHGHNVLIWDYPGYGLSEGQPNYDSCNAGALRAAEVAKQIAGKRGLLFYGTSLGGPHAAKMAARYPGSKLCLDRTFANMKMATRGLGFGPLAQIGRRIWPYNTAQSIRELDNVKMLIHWGRQDALFKQEHASALAEATNNRVVPIGTESRHAGSSNELFKLFLNEDLYA